MKTGTHSFRSVSLIHKSRPVQLLLHSAHAEKWRKVANRANATKITPKFDICRTKSILLTKKLGQHVMRTLIKGSAA